ncbi:sigma-70 family RNA polymerase sigma factor [Amycolatopsis cynarae]|uniref:Sigma-70 family RNA polymerase sigma factor n=1 Tax=Amycolatopsis cynarae TaxID=2995223 RepID=A0ABY7B735_9PSEU|nr:sigma-70 family RNA polymerase sigma factor [Amycolatopsis sp. HUAS 11-8]WAL67797.1 sigma-70 family RNA polymerase sigma factor [Amycolatopsis sp. HUAS 11-8]
MGVRTNRRGDAKVTDADGPPESLRTERDVETAYARYGNELFGFVLNAVRDRPLAEELVQEIFFRAWRASARFDPAAGTLRTWLFAIARNSVADSARRRSVRARVEQTGRSDRPDGPNPADPFDRLLTAIQLDEALQRLSPEHRQTVVEVYYHGRTCAELGGELGIPASTVRSRLYYGVRALRLLLQENGGLVS